MYKKLKENRKCVGGEANSPMHSSIRRVQNNDKDVLLLAQGFQVSKLMSQHKSAQLKKRPILEPIVHKRKLGTSILSTVAYPSASQQKKLFKTVVPNRQSYVIRLPKDLRKNSDEALHEYAQSRTQNSNAERLFRNLSVQNPRNSPFPDDVCFSKNHCEMPRSFSPYFGSDINVESQGSISLGRAKQGNQEAKEKLLRRNGSFNKSCRYSSDVENPLKPNENLKGVENEQSINKIIMYKTPIKKARDISKLKQAAKEGHVAAQLKLLNYKLSQNHNNT